MPKLSLNSRNVTQITCPEGKRKETFFDTSTKGLALEVRESGGKTYYLRYTNDRGKTRYLKLACARDVSLAQARKLCDQQRNKIAMGLDPLEAKATHRQVLTFEAFARDMYLPMAKATKRSWKTDEVLFRVHLLPMFGNKHLDEITTADVLAFQQRGISAGAKPASINRRVHLLRHMLNVASNKWQLPGVTKNPTDGVPSLTENNRKERYISPEEMGRLYQAVQRSECKMLAHIVAFLVVTGARKTEVLRASWTDIDMQRANWRIPETKAGYARHVPLNDAAMRILAVVRGLSRSEYIFGNPDTGTYYSNIWQSWNTARRRAGLAEVRIHDLRHTFASMLVNSGRSLYEVQKLLGHTQVKTTQRYAHLTRETLMDASNAATVAMAPALGLVGHADVIEGGSAAGL